jgi:lipopolysaccharide export system permease protein
MPGPRLAAHLRREALGVSSMALAILVSITLALFLGELLGDVADGQVLLSTLLELLVLRVPEALVLTAPLALVVGLLLGFGELAQNREFSVIRAAGVRPGRVLRTLLGVSLLWALALGVVSAWIAPWAEQRSQSIAERMADDLLLASIQPGRFQSLAGGRLSVYVRDADLDQGLLQGVFVHFEREDGFEAVSAASGRLYRRPADGRRVLALHDGMHLGYAKEPGLLPMRRIEFERNLIELPFPESGGGEPMRQLGPVALLELGSGEAWVEIQRRLMPSIISLMLAAFALPITLSGARGRRFTVVLVAIVAYLVYSNLASLMLGRLPESARQWPGIWPLHGAALLAVVWPLSSWWRRW